MAPLQRKVKTPNVRKPSRNPSPVKRVKKEQLLEGLNERQRKFAHEYVFDYNASRAYAVAFPGVTDKSAGQLGHHLLKNLKVANYIEEIQQDMAKLAGISKLKVVNEFRKLAFTSIAHLHNTWIERKEFEQLTEDEKASISEITTRISKKNNGTKRNPDWMDVEFVHIKLYDKQRALDSLNKMLGFNSADKLEIVSKTNIQDLLLQDKIKNLTEAELQLLHTLQGKIKTKPTE